MIMLIIRGCAQLMIKSCRTTLRNLPKPMHSLVIDAREFKIAVYSARVVLGTVSMSHYITSKAP